MDISVGVAASAAVAGRVSGVCWLNQTSTPLPPTPTWDEQSRQSEPADSLAASPAGRHTWEPAKQEAERQHYSLEPHTLCRGRNTVYLMIYFHLSTKKIILAHA